MFERNIEGLKQCPFCGGNAILERFETAHEKKPRFRVKYISCWCMTDWDNWSEEEAKNKWNSMEGKDNGN